MFNVCPACGEYSEEKIVDPAGPFAVCRYCRHPHPFRQLPLYVVTGASGSGKTALCLELARRVQTHVVLETDILWGALPATPDDNYRSYWNAWLRIAKNVGQGGRPVVLLGSSTPEQVEACTERRYFGETHYLALVCEEAVLVERLRSRPGWRGSSSDGFIQSMVSFNRWLREHAATTSPPMELLDTSRLTLEATVAAAMEWLTPRHTPSG